MARMARWRTIELRVKGARRSWNRFGFLAKRGIPEGISNKDDNEKPDIIACHAQGAAALPEFLRHDISRSNEGGVVLRS